MGGFGSGNWQRPRKGHVEECPHIDIRQWYREFPMFPSLTFRLTLSTNGSAARDINVYPWFKHVVITHINQSANAIKSTAEEIIAIDFTGCHYGGERPWFVCPALPCGKRAAILYHGAEGFRCRRCADLAYPSQCENRALRAMRKARKLRLKLGARSSLVAPLPTKPARMHGHRYLILLHAAIDAQAQSWHEIEAVRARWRWVLQQLDQAVSASSQTNGVQSAQSR